MSETSTDFSLKRIDALARCACALGACGVWYHRIVIEGAHNLPQEGAAYFYLNIMPIAISYLKGCYCAGLQGGMLLM